jgi:hypothetical protein
MALERDLHLQPHLLCLRPDLPFLFRRATSPFSPTKQLLRLPFLLRSRPDQIVITQLEHRLIP